MMPLLKEPKPAIGFVFVTAILMVLGFGIIVPVFPRLVIELEGGDVSAGSHQFGWLVGTFSLVQFFASPVLGVLSDRFGRRPVILISLAGSAVGFAVIGLAPNLTWLFIARIIAGMTAGALTACNAYVTDVTPPERRAKGFGLMGAAFGLGLVIGPALGGVAGQVHLRLPFFVAAACALANLVYGAIMLPESLPIEKRRKVEWRRANPVGSLLALRGFQGVVNLSGVHFIYMLGTVMVQSVWVLYTGYRYGWSAQQVGLSLAFVGVMIAIVQGKLVQPITSRFGEPKTLVGGLLISAAFMTACGLSPEGWMIYALVLLGAFGGVVAPAAQALLTRRVPGDQQGSLQGALTALTSLASIFAPPIAAWSFGAFIAPDRKFELPGVAFFEAATLMLIALVLALRSFRIEARRPPRDPGEA